MTGPRGRDDGIDPAELLGLPMDDAIARLSGLGTVECDPSDDPHDPEGRRYATMAERGIALVIERSVVTTVQLFSGATRGCGAWPSAIGEGVEFAMSRGTVRALLGTPVRSSGPSHVPMLGRYPPWDLFNREGRTMHFEYADDAGTGIRMVSLSGRSDARNASPTGT